MATPDEAMDLAAVKLREKGVDVPLGVLAQARVAARKLHATLREGGRSVEPRGPRCGSAAPAPTRPG